MRDSGCDELGRDDRGEHSDVHGVEGHSERGMDRIQSVCMDA